MLVRCGILTNSGWLTTKIGHLFSELCQTLEKEIMDKDRIVGSAKQVKGAVKETSNKQVNISHPGMMGDGTEEQNLNERGNPAARIKKDDVDAAFDKSSPKE